MNKYKITIYNPNKMVQNTHNTIPFVVDSFEISSTSVDPIFISKELMENIVNKRSGFCKDTSGEIHAFPYEVLKELFFVVKKVE